MKMTDQQYAQYINFMEGRRHHTEQQTPEEREHFYEQVKRRVIAYLEATGNHDLKAMLANDFWGGDAPYSSIQAMNEAHALGWTETHGNNPYKWYKLLKPHAMHMAKISKAFTAHFEKLNKGV